MLKDDDTEVMMKKLDEASKAIERYKEELLQKQLREQENGDNVYAPGINADHDPLEHAFDWEEGEQATNGNLGIQIVQGSGNLVR